MQKSKNIQKNIEEFQEKMENLRKLPDNTKKEIRKEIIYNIVIAVILIAFLCMCGFFYYKFSERIFTQIMKYIALITIIITVTFFEISYRKESIKMCIIGIELLLCSVVSLYVPYIYLYASYNLKRLLMFFPIAIIVYYLIKAFVIYKTKKVKYRNGLSDIRKILENENISYIDEESSKSFRKNMKEEEQIKKELLEEQIARKNRIKNLNKKGK